MKTSQLIINALALSALTLPGMAYADSVTKEGYLTDSRGNVVRSGSGLCWHTGSWKPSMAIEECDTVIPKKVAAVPVPPAESKVATILPAEPKKMTVLPVESKKIIIHADSSAGGLFAFNKSTITPEGKHAFSKFTDELKDARYDVITVTGHTDRIGSQAYNMKLSTRRAEAVKVYMIETLGIASDKITAKGMGEEVPVTKPGECKGNKATRQLIACLAPDRRVEVEVSTTRTANQ
ncbi:MAG: OmpA family protein [Gallionella sp.]|nr:OmpA family protein [Gallionella sp.]